MKSVIIVGGGVVGLFCAVRLAKAGARVTLLEAEGEHADLFGPGASVAAAGMLAPLDEAVSPHTQLAFESYDLWRRWREGAEWADGVRFDGGVRIADEAGASGIAQASERMGRRAQMLRGGQFRKRTGFTADHAAIFVEDEGVADPQRVLSGLAMQARSHGVIVEYGQDVASATARSVTTHEGQTWEADIVVLAPGAWATDKLIDAAPALRHVTAARGHIVEVKLQRPLASNLHGPGFYLAQRREDVVLGSTMEPGQYQRRVDQSQVEALLAAVNATLPGDVAPAGRAWCGIRPMSPDGWPMVGPTGEGLFVAAGHSRNGWLMAPVTAEIISAYVLGGEIPDRWAALSPQRFESQTS
jgi:glycine oxidase